MKVILTKDKCLAAIGKRPAEVTDDSKWDEMDGNAIVNLHLELADGVLSSIEEKKTVIINLTSNILADYLVFDDVEAAILEEENRRNNREDKQTSSRQGNVASTSKDGNALCCEAVVANEGRKRFTDIWMFDTGATFHMTAKREWFHQYKPISRGRFVYSCNNHKLKIIGIKSILVKMHDGIVRTIRDVRHVDGLKKNLLSIGQLDDLGCKVEIQNKIMKIIKGALVLMRGEKVAANLYQLKGEIIEEAEASVASHSPSHRVAVTWHQKLGHMSEQGMKILVERKLLLGLTKVSLPFCEHCVISKQHRLKFKTSNSRSVYVLELVHSDVWQAPVQSLRGAKYFVSFIDDYSRRCWVYPIKKKSDVFEVFKVYKAQARRYQKAVHNIIHSSTEWCGKADEQNLVRKSKRNVSNFKDTDRDVDGKAGKLFRPSYIWKSCGYRLWHPTTHKVVVSRDVVFMEDKNQENEEDDSTTKESTSIQMEKEFHVH
ncbi:gag-pol polyprotein [Tanacetum coccineum]